jgi:hypothetical protein
MRVFWMSHTTIIILQPLMQMIEYSIISPHISQITLDIEGFRLRFVSVYAPAHLAEREDFFSQTLSKLDYQLNTIMVGDFNTYKFNDLVLYPLRIGYRGWQGLVTELDWLRLKDIYCESQQAQTRYTAHHSYESVNGLMDRCMDEAVNDPVWSTWLTIY